MNRNGKPDIVIVEEKVDWSIKHSYFAKVAWLENMGDLRKKRFISHVVDRVICPHSLSVADLDETELLKSW